MARKCIANGSPLRGQGTPTGGTGAQNNPRFTPARAGNTTRLTSSTGRPAVHPCAGREHWLKFQTWLNETGSPLRGQGTPHSASCRRDRHRFTPARAGNTPIRTAAPHRLTVHPCAGREHGIARVSVHKTRGSPLRGQGTLLIVFAPLAFARFTPARAGNTIHGAGRVAAGHGSPLRGQGTLLQFL